MVSVLIYISFIIALLIVAFNVSIYSALNKIFRFKSIKKNDIKISIVVAAKMNLKIFPSLYKH